LACELRAACCVAVVLLLAACGTSSGPVPSSGSGARSAAPSRRSPPAASPSAPRVATPGGVDAPPAVPGLHWRAQGSSLGHVPVTYVATTDHGLVSLLWMDPARLRFRLIAGTQVPERSPTLAQDQRPSTWMGAMVAAFNGGFWLKDHAGGFVDAGHVVAPLKLGYASMVITTAGALTVDVWTRSSSMSRVAVVRQNLQPVVVAGHVAPVGVTGRGGWSVPSKGSYVANRSALAELADGSLVYLFGYHVTPTTMARALLSVGARTAMMLDMNGSWPMAFTYTHAPTLAGQRLNPHQYHDPSVYLSRYRKDFVVALT
jgi:hypothetical protein